MKRKYYVWILVLFIFIIALVSNPDTQAHKNTVKIKMSNYVQEVLDNQLSGSTNIFGQLGLAFGKVLGGSVIDVLVNDMVSRGNYFVFSTTRIRWEGKNEVIGIGIFGNVFLNPRIDKEIEKYLKELNPVQTKPSKNKETFI
jgi:hypothetical protein